MNKYFNSQLILDFMKEQNFSKTKFCKICGISISTLNKILNDDISIRITALRKIAKGMLIEIKQLLVKQNKA